MHRSSTSVSPAQRCDSCSERLGDMVYIGHIGTTHQTFVCPACAAYHSAGQFLLYQVEQARQIIRAHQARLNTSLVQR
jgi:hypothetical protein